MKDNGEELLAWAKKNIGPEGMQILIETASKGIEFEAQFMENPFKFCAAHEYKVYMGSGPDRPLDKTYVFVYQQNDNSFAVVWIYPDGYAPAYVVSNEPLQNFINIYNFSLVDNEIFLLWLNENKDIIQKAYQSCKSKYDQLIAVLKQNPSEYYR
jgi:hypothetical protein